MSDSNVACLLRQEAIFVMASRISMQASMHALQA